jgi:hypothetical protein
MSSIIDDLPVVTGNISPEMVDNIYQILGKHSETSGFEGLRDYVKRKGCATVTSRTTGEEVINMDRRQCNRWTFGENIVKELDDLILPSIMESDIDMVNVKSHGDVLVYEKGDFFKEHRDTVEAKPPLPSPDDYFHYTILLALYDTEEGGETGIITPMKGAMKKVLYTETTREGQFLLFPSEQMHFGNEIKSGTKMVLKLDYWMRYFPQYPYSVEDMQSEYENYYEISDDDSWCNGYHL